VKRNWTVDHGINTALRLGLIFILLLISRLACAQDGFDRNMRYLEDNGVQRLGGQSVQSLRDQGREIPVHNRDTTLHLDNEGNSRRSGQWNQDGIELSALHSERMNPENWDAVVTHEKCQKLSEGTCDQNFQNTGLIEAHKSYEKMRKQRPDLKLIELPLKSFEKDLDRKGGVTAVGGGGDGRIVDYMRAIYLDLMMRLARGRINWETFHRIHEWFTLVKVEVSADLPQGGVEIDSVKQTLYIPKDAFVGDRFDLNLDACGRLVDALTIALQVP
jgi:hypothetical protein